MDPKKKAIIISLCVLAVIISVFLGVMSGSSNKGTSNTIEFNNPEDASAPSALTKFEEGLNALVEQGHLDAATKDIALAAAKKYDTEFGGQANAFGENNIIALSALKEKNLISSEVYDTLKTAVDKQSLAVREAKFGPLVTGGSFADIDKVEKAYNSFFEQYSVKSNEQKDAMNKEIESANPPLTDTEKQKKINEFKAGQEQRIDDVLSAMTTKNEITKSQAEALKTLITK